MSSVALTNTSNPPFDISKLVTQAVLLPSSSSSSFSHLPKSTSSLSNNTLDEQAHSSNNNMEQQQQQHILNDDSVILEETTTTDVDNTVIATITTKAALGSGPGALVVEGVALVDDEDDEETPATPESNGEPSKQESLSTDQGAGLTKSKKKNSLTNSAAALEDLETISTMTTVKTTSTTKKVVKRHSSLSAQTMNQAIDQSINQSSSSQPQQEEQYTTLKSSTPTKKNKEKKASPINTFFKSIKGVIKSLKKNKNNKSTGSSTTNSQNSKQEESFNPSILVTQAPKNVSTHSAISTSTQSEMVDDSEIIRTTTTMTTTVRRKSIDMTNAPSDVSKSEDDKLEVETEEELQCTTTTVTTKKKKKKQGDSSLTIQEEEVKTKKRPKAQSQTALLPPQRAHVKGKKTLVLDLDETLVHSVFVHTDQADFVIPIEMEGRTYSCYVLKRPGVDEYLRELGQYYEIIIFTASLSLYANPLLDILDKHGVIEGRLFREHCTKVGDTYIKDLSRLGRDMDQTIIVDNSPSCYALQPQNALPCTTWYDDQNDRELGLLADCLKRLERERAVYDGLKSWKELISSGVNVTSWNGGSAMTVSSTSHHHQVIKKRM